MHLSFAETQQDPATFCTEQAYHRLRRINTAIDSDDLIRSSQPIPTPPRDDTGALPPVVLRRSQMEADTGGSDTCLHELPAVCPCA